jgi:hypothetical protein
LVENPKQRPNGFIIAQKLKELAEKALGANVEQLEKLLNQKQVSEEGTAIYKRIIGPAVKARLYSWEWESENRLDKLKTMMKQLWGMESYFDQRYAPELLRDLDEFRKRVLQLQLQELRDIIVPSPQSPRQPRSPPVAEKILSAP